MKSLETKKARLKRLRAAFRESVFARDAGRCRVCGGGVDLDAHHISDRHCMPNDGYATSNGVTLCGGDRIDSCHMKAESYHASEGKYWEDGFHPDELYALIGSSMEQAQRDSKNLE